VQLTSCSITNTTKEGLLAVGTYENAATAAQGARRESAYRDERARIASNTAEAWGKQHGGDLVLDVTGCTISNCGNFGASLDYGCQASISRCRFLSNDPFSVFVKGGCNVLLAACQFVYSSKSSQSPWAKSTGQGRSLKMAGEGATEAQAHAVQRIRILQHGCSASMANFVAVHMKMHLCHTYSNLPATLFNFLLVSSSAACTMA
jgi:hypothetical protein